MIAGLLEMNGKTREVSFHIEAIPPEADGASTAQGYRAVTSISRADFGIPSPMIGTSDTVSIRVTLGMRQETLRLATTTTMEVTP